MKPLQSVGKRILERSRKVKSVTLRAGDFRSRPFWALRLVSCLLRDPGSRARWGGARAERRTRRLLASLAPLLRRQARPWCPGLAGDASRATQPSAATAVRTASPSPTAKLAKFLPDSPSLLWTQGEALRTQRPVGTSNQFRGPSWFTPGPDSQPDANPTLCGTPGQALGRPCGS